jgi:superfamily II DNA helicase RecQ
MQNYINQISQLKNPTFQEIRKIANNSIANLSKVDRDRLHNKLGRGVTLLDSHELLCQYLWDYGNMHQAKLLNAFKKLPPELLRNPFEVIDWGCGQAMATINLFDFLKQKGYGNNIRKVTLVEPAKEALERAVLHTSAYTSGSIEIKPVCSYFEKITPDQITGENDLPQIHIFSNILDVVQIDLKQLSKLIDSSVISDSYLLCVGPLNATNPRIDAFLRYFDEGLIKLVYAYESRHFREGNMRNLNTCKIRIYKLEPLQEGHLIPIEYYPSVQFQAAYELDMMGALRKNKILTFDERLTHFEVAAPFDLGASVYDDVHPVLAVANNIITRGLPTKASLFIEEKMEEAFGLTSRTVTYGEIRYLPNVSLEFSGIGKLFHSCLDNLQDISPEQAQNLQLLLTPVAIARFQKMLIEAIITGKLSLENQIWKILIEEEDVPFGVLAIKDLKNLFQNLSELSEEYQNVKLPEIELTVISNKFFTDSPLHLDHEIITEATNAVLKSEYDLVVTQAVLKSVSKSIEAFSKFRCRNNCYFNIRTIDAKKTERVIYTSDKIKYRSLVEKDSQGNYIELEETKMYLTYFLQLLFRKEAFRPGQLPILDRALKNLPVIGLLPTGGGKSLTYQIAAFLQPGVTLVIDPLKSLMKDQYDGLLNSGIDNAAFINSSLSSDEKEKREKQLESSQLLFCFLSPERLSIASFRERLKNMHEHNVYFSYGVIDEVHCVSEWGHDFRFSYLHLGRNLYQYVKSKNRSISLFGLTATASFDVLADVERELSGSGAFDLDADVIVRYENTNRLELQYKIERINIPCDDEYTALKKSEYATPEKLRSIENKYRDLINDGFSLPVKVANRGFYEAKSEFLINYIQRISDYFSEITDASIENIKNAFFERQGSKIGVDIDIKVEVEHDFYEQKDEYQHAGIVFCPHKNNTGISVQFNKNNLESIIPDIGTYSGGDNDVADVDIDQVSMQNLELFRSNRQPLMVATKAFGMGIDKPNVRFTINMNYSSSLESFVQEAGRAGRDRKMALSVILLSDYKLARINNNLTEGPPILNVIRGKWFEFDEFQKIIKYYRIKANENHIDFLTPEHDLVRLFCKEGENAVYFNFKNCRNINCHSYSKCKLRKVPKEAENWIYNKDLELMLIENKLKIPPKHLEYYNADYAAVMYFYNNNFKGEFIERYTMLQLLNQKDLMVSVEDNNSIDFESEKQTVKGFLTTLRSAEVGQKIISYINYQNSVSVEGNVIDHSDIAKAIYRMTCIGLIEDFTQNYKNKQYRIVAERKKEGDYFNGLKNFLLRYYSPDRAEEELRNVYLIRLTNNIDSEFEREIFQCLSYLTTFVYEKISVKRKRAIDEMRNFCIEGLSENGNWLAANERLKDYLFYYFNSKYAKNDYVAENDEPFSLLEDTDRGKISGWNILFKYLRVATDKDIIGISTPLDNVKHLYGAVRLISRSLTDSNPALSLLDAFCLACMGTKNNPSLENQLYTRYSEGFIEAENRSHSLLEFWEMFGRYNEIIAAYVKSNIMKELKEEVMMIIHTKQLKKITDNYTN